ncbi:replicative DNA helicase [Kitasatospora sp. NBC_01287]|uniref:replicative DNA helicase n=1 Tax=Kitasatospora sp. NBC_01287 TaxID=2903573 RepID=UPI00224E0C36|nr:replicative DNA helicase [Kitasatospora sp. NBC_01287]MCX4750954.1 replicative DNA helicase [Kitasatospora sp. NBC_01287]MCX4751795.1 replicative DNA helicase [Kitasatospora sp. NBC_01287]MCX4751913.1 replicative DNA helicase [Kitasatospora sp. NBC_01287]
MTLFDTEPADAVAQSIERVSPQNIPAEQAVIGAMLLSKDAITEVVDILTAEDYYRGAHQLLHRTIVGLYQRGEPADPFTVQNALDANDLVRVGGVNYLFTCSNSAPTAASAGYYADIVKAQATLRAIVDTGTSLVQAGYASAGGDAEEVLDHAAGLLQKLTATSSTTAVSREKPLHEVLDNTMAMYFNPGDGSLPIPYADLAELAPVEKTDLVVVAASPGMGKTTVMTDWARCVSIANDGRTLVGSMEMPHTQIGQRIICAEAKVNLKRFRARCLDDDEMHRVAMAIQRIHAKQLRIDDSPRVPVSRMKTRLRQMQAVGELPDLYVVDYLQIAKAEAEAGANRTTQVDSIAVGLKELAQEFEIVVVAAAQLNRQVSQRPDKVPMMSDLRESGGIEQNANVVILLHREDYYEKTSPRAGELDLIVAKNRMGTTGTATVAFKGHLAHACDLPHDS